MTHPGSPFWVPSPALQRHVNRAATGNPDIDWLSWVRAVHLSPAVPRALVLGCSRGHLEQALARKDGIGAITAVDADPAAVERARRQAERAGLAAISYAVFDPDTDALPDGPWNAIFASDLLHHVPSVETLFGRVAPALARDGRFVFHEYVGPNSFQYSDAHMELVQRYFRILPDRLRKDPSTGRLLWRRERIDAARLARESPAEAAESEELLPRARRGFACEAEYSGGGGLLHPTLMGLAENFRQGAPEEERLLEILCAAEEQLVSSGLIADSFRVFVGRKPMT